jgi:hypothetical protein
LHVTEQLYNEIKAAAKKQLPRFKVTVLDCRLLQQIKAPRAWNMLEFVGGRFESVHPRLVAEMTLERLQANVNGILCFTFEENELYVLKNLL